MKVLYIHPAGTFGGASKSLIELFSALRDNAVEGYVLTPKGSAADAFSRIGLKTIQVLGLSQFDNTRFGHYRGLRWLILLRELYYFPISILALWRIKRSHANFDLIHVNEITLLPVGILAKILFKVPIIFHIRSLQRNDSCSIRTRWIFKLINKYADAIICIDQTVKGSIPSWINASVVHNSIKIDSQDMSVHVNSSPHKLTVGMAGVFLKSKGVYEFIEAARILLIDKKYDVRFIIAGENARKAKGILGFTYKILGFSDDVVSNVKKYISEHNLEHHIDLPGLVSDIRSLYQTLDVLCFPSYLNACGRPVFEAAFYGIPSIVAIKEPPEDAIIDGVTGLVIDRPDPDLLAQAIEKLILEPTMRQRLGEEAKFWAKRFFLLESNAKYVFEIYQNVLNRLKC